MPDNAQSAANVYDCRKEVEMNMNKQKLTILYERLSVEDERDGESNSITNQRKLLEEYAERNGFTPYIHLADDGISGTRFDRPGYIKMMYEVESCNVGQIIIKDMTRLGRDHIRVGLCLEILREKNVRLIAVNDGVDTFMNDDDFLPFRNILSEWYARDTSRKIKSALAVKGKSGKTLTNIPPYGYIKDPNDKYKWLIDPEAAAVVKRIFEMAIDGMGPNAIAAKLYEEKIERPSYYHARHGRGIHKNTYDKEHPYSWRFHTVATILSRLEYTGCTANFQREKPSFKSKRSIIRPKEDWMIFEDTHEKIVTREMWELVQKLRGTKRRHDTIGEFNPLTGLMYCADCGCKMFNQRSAAPRKLRKGDKIYLGAPPNYYTCSTFKRTSFKHDPKCTPHYANTNIIRQIILVLLRETNGYIRANESEFIELVREKSILRKNETAKEHKKKIAKNERRIAELEKIFLSLYEDKALGKISESRFDEMSAVYELEQTELKAETALLQTELDAFSADSVRADKYLELVHRFTDFEELTPTILNEFVDKIIIHEREWSDGRSPISGRGLGESKQKVEVHLKYVGAFDVPDTRSPEEIEAERVRLEHAEKVRKQKRDSARRINEKRRKATASSEPEPVA